jgi:hypothetical protein
MKYLLVLLIALSTLVATPVQSQSTFGGWRVWCEVNSQTGEERCWYIRYNPGKGKGTKKGGKK